MLSRIECLKILGLGPKANQYEVENRYTLLIKRYRGKEDDDIVRQLDQITLAYNILTGRHIEPEPLDPRLETVVFGKSRRQWRNIWHYGRWPLFFGILVFSLVVYLVYTIATNKPADFQIVAAGIYGAAEDADTRIDAYVKSIFPEFEKVEFQTLPIDLREPDPSASESNALSGGGDAQNQYAYIMKMMTLIAGDSIEVFLCDKPVFDQYAPQGPFADLTALYARLQDLPPDILAKIKPLRRQIRDSSEDVPFTNETAATTQSTEEAANQDTSLPIYGLDVSELHLTEGLGLYSDTQILTLGFKADVEAQAEKFLETWIRDYEKMHQMQQAFEDKIKASVAAEESAAAAASSEAAAKASQAAATTAA